ncbi:hypothetical protein ACH5RR_006996 [Cinchona calisaya]|uniref:Uncharacterized protein n=1 Tax=Cinchona calisaya TaxID=153742 RepID=A0ABD3AQK6_9GENT
MSKSDTREPHGSTGSLEKIHVVNDELPFEQPHACLGNATTTHEKLTHGDIWLGAMYKEFLQFLKGLSTESEVDSYWDWHAFGVQGKLPFHLLTLKNSDQSLHVKVTHDDWALSVDVTFVYTKCTLVERRRLWANLIEIVAGCSGH